VVDQPPPPPRNNRRWMGCAGLIALALLLALLGLVCAGAIGGLTAWWSTRTPPAPVATVVMDGGVLNGAVMCADAWNEGSVINTGTLVHTTIPSGIDGVYQVVELRGATQDGIGRCTANGAVVQASDVLAAVRKHPAGNDIPMGGYTLIGFGTQRF
ncbi:hypothetical protein KJ895_01005, partial [Patescibacteria group bacterium]|nr:hypothetical protein [Patescibacteria group bacterium]